MEDKKYELVWVEFNRNDRQVTKRKEFKSEAAMQKFIEKLVKKGTSVQFMEVERCRMEKLNKKQALERALDMLTSDVAEYLINQYNTMTYIGITEHESVIDLGVRYEVNLGRAHKFKSYNIWYYSQEEIDKEYLLESGAVAV